MRELAVTQSGDLVAWVSGSSTYATKVSLDKGALASVCTCPYYRACKHAVAVILEYLDCFENRQNVPEAGKDDERLALVERGPGYPEEDDEAITKKDHPPSPVLTTTSNKNQNRNCSIF